MNRAQAAYTMLKERGTVRMGDLPPAGTLNSYTGRNAFAEAKALAAADGYVITHAYGKDWKENSYTLQTLPTESEGQTIKAACHKCGNVFEARRDNVKAGHGRFCSRKCAGAIGGKRRAELAGLARAQIGVQAALL